MGDKRQASNINSKALQTDSEVEVESSDQNSNIKRKRYNRHTPQQIQLMEEFYKEFPHPDEKQRKELSLQLGIEPIQVKFWFQNKRTQMKTQHEHKENNQLRTENEKLRAENLRFREALSNASCPNCGVPTLREPSLRQFMSKPSSTETPSSSSATRNMWCWMNNEAGNEDYRAVVIEVAAAAMEELMRIGQLGEPLWVASVDRHTYVLNQEEYFRAFSRVFGPTTDGFKSEASRESVIVPTNAADVVEILMDVERWTNVFSGVVARATNLQVVSSRLDGTYHEVVQVMNAEFHVPSPVVPTRESYFVRQCRRHVDGTWAVVDVSLDHLRPTPFNTCRRRPSGCLIQDMPNGYSKVIWVEHVEVEDGGVHSIYKPLIAAGLAFGARRWVAILNGYCQRITTGLVSASHLVGNEQGRKSMLQLAERMVTRFCCGVNASISNTWTTITGFGSSADNIKIMTRKNVDDPTTPLGFQLSIATSFWLPMPPRRVFDYLRNHTIRKEWDVLLNGDVEEMAYVVSGNEDGNRVTMYQVKGMNSSSNQILLQESRKDPTAAYIVYAPMDVVSANMVLGGGDPSHLPLLPSGFAILPDGPTRGGYGRGATVQTETGGSLLTVALQVLVDSTPDADLCSGSVAVAYKIICDIMDKIKQALIP